MERFFFNASAAMKPILWSGLILATLLAATGSARAETFDHCGFTPNNPDTFSEREFTVQTPDGRIQGTLAVPDNGEPKALALMLHGFRGARNENGGMFRRTAHAFAGFGIASLRIDFIGSGKSDGEWADTRFSTQARDAMRAADALKDAFDGALPVSVLGYSQGGLVALRTSASKEVFNRVAIWAPALDPIATYSIIFGEETILNAARAHREEGTNDVVEGKRLRSGYFAELAEADPIGEASKVKSPLLIVTGERDPLVKQGDRLAKETASKRSGKTELLHVNGGHDFGALREPQLLAHVVACTAKFLIGKGS